MGRPTKLTTQKHRQFVRLLEAGNYRETVGRACRIGTSTLYRWLERGVREESGIYHDFRVDVERAEAEAEVGAVAIVLQTVDSAFKTGVANDYSLIATWATDRRFFYLVDIWRGRVEYPDLKRKINEQYAKHAPSVILVEDAAFGQSLIQDLKRESGLPIVARPPKGSKESRVAAISGFLEPRVLLPEQGSFVEPWIEEHVGFRAGAPHDDQVDTTVLALEEIRPNAGQRVRALVGR